MHTRGLLVLAAAMALSACETVNQTVAFNADDFRPYDFRGNASIRGHAFVRTDDGRLHNAAGLNVYLVPLTPYTDERANIMLSDDEPPPADPRLGDYVRTVVADNGGFFEFKGLPPGNYLVYCRIVWWRRRLGASGDYYAVGKTTVVHGEKKHLVVSNNTG